MNRLGSPQKLGSRHNLLRPTLWSTLQLRLHEGLIITPIPSGTVTFLFTDVEASTRKWEQHQTAMEGAMARHDAILRTAIDSEDGSVFTTAGDAFCAAFSSAQNALAAAMSIQTTLNAEDWGAVAPFLVRVALHTGNADERDGDYFGPTLNRCARLLAIGHGGQTLVSATTAQLLLADLPSDLHLDDLGAHELKDLDRPEHVFQVVHPELNSEFPALRSRSPVRDAADLLAEGNKAHAEQQWDLAYLSLTAAGEAVELTAEDLQRQGDAAFWTGRGDQALAIKEKAYGKFSNEGKKQPAALMALDLGILYKYRLAVAVSNAWVARAEALVGDAVGTEAYGYLLRWKSVDAFEHGGDPERALSLADDTIACGVEVGSRSLESLGLMDKGRFLVAMGQVEEGMVLVDESMVAAVAGELDPDATGRNFCNMLAVCDQVADYERAAEWSDAAEEWCNQHSDSAYPGICRVFRAELKWRRGDWSAATDDLRRAMDELTGFTPIIGAAFYQIGQVERRAGRFESAGKMFLSAHEHGFSPLPGMAALRLAEGNPEAAEQLLLDALVRNPLPLDRAKYLPTLVDTEMALGNLVEAQTFLAEFEEAAELCSSSAMRAEVADRRAAMAMIDGRADDAVQELHKAIKGWTGLQMPYEAAQSRLRLGDAHLASGNAAAASMETDSANATLRRFSAASPE